MSYAVPTKDSLQDICQYSSLYYKKSKTHPNASNRLSERLSGIFQEKPKNIISWTGKFRIRWDLFIIFLAIFNCLSVPYFLTFSLKQGEHPLFIIIEFTIDFIFAVDIYFNFKTSFINCLTGEEIFSRKKIRIHYIKSSRFVIDLLACLPVGLVEFLVNQSLIVSSLKIFKVARILRLGKIINYWRIKQDIKIPFRIGRLLLFAIIYLHFLACIWKAIVTLDEEWEPAAKAVDPDFSIYELESGWQYPQFLYVALASLVGIESMPTNNLEYISTSCFIILGALLFGYILGEIAVLISDINAGARAFSRAMDSMSNLMCYFKLEENLQMQISDYFKVTYQMVKKNESWAYFMSFLPSSLKEEINRKLYSHLILSQPTFAVCSSSSLKFISNLTLEFKLPSERLIEMLEESEAFYIVVDGCLDVVVEGLDGLDHTVRRLYEGDFCGEVGIIYNKPRSARVTALNYCAIGVITKEIFLEVLNCSPEIGTMLREIIANYNDPYKLQIKRTMKKIPYLQGIDHVALDRLYYSMSLEDFNENTIVFEEGAKAKKVYIILEGSVVVYCKIYDFQFKKRLSKNKRRLDTNISKSRSSKTLSNKSLRRISIRKELDHSKKAHLKLCKLKQGSIMCGIQVLFQRSLNVHSFTRKYTRMMVLKIEDIEAMACENLRLKFKIENIRNKCQFPQFDCYKKFINDIPGVEEFWRINRRWKNAILSVVANNRSVSTIKPKFFLQRLRAVIFAEKHQRFALAEMIAKRDLSCNAVRALSFIKEHDFKIPVMVQFGLLHSEFYNSLQRLLDNSVEINRRIDKLKRRRERLCVKIAELLELVSLVSKYIRK